jgi:hypothetical protein
VRTEFITRDAYVREGVPTFIVPMDTETTNKINRLAMRLASEGLGLVVNQRESDVMLQIVPVQAISRAKTRLSSPSIPLLLFLATIVTRRLRVLLFLRLRGRTSGLGLVAH